MDNFKPEYFSGLNWRDAEKLVGKFVEFSDNGNTWYGPSELSGINSDQQKVKRYYASQHNDISVYIYIRTCPETFKHPTIIITVNGKEYKLPKPETEVPRLGATVWIVTPFHPDGYVESVWQGFGGEQIALEKGYVHLIESRAQAWADRWENTIIKAVNCD